MPPSNGTTQAFQQAYPYATSITRLSGSVSTTASFSVTFNQAVTGLDPYDFYLVATGNVAFAVDSISITGSGANYIVNVTGITGAGTLGLNLVDLPSITASPSFAAQTTVDTGVQPLSVTLGDVNGDGRLDIITANFASSNVSVLLGNGNGTFRNQATFDAGVLTTSVTVCDVNVDGKLDIVAASFLGTGSVLLGNGDGTFQNQDIFPTEIGTFSVSMGDVDGDGKLDIITPIAGNISILFGNGNGTFGSKTDYATGNGTFTFAATLADVNGDGRLDIITANRNSNTPRVI